MSAKQIAAPEISNGPHVFLTPNMSRPNGANDTETPVSDRKTQNIGELIRRTNFSLISTMAAPSEFSGSDSDIGDV